MKRILITRIRLHTTLCLTMLLVFLSVGAGHVYAQKMYWTDLTQGEIRRADLDGGNMEVLYDGLNYPYFFELDPADGRIFWAENYNTLVHVSYMDGSGHIETLDIGLIRIRDIGLDFTHGMIYWGDRESHTIHRCHLDGTGSEILFDEDDGLDRPHGMALDIPSELIYWVDTTAGTVNRGAMDGSGAVDVLYDGLVSPWDIELDFQEGKVYWTDKLDFTICRGDMDGSGPPEVILTSEDGLGIPQGLDLDVDNGKMYWADSGFDLIRRANLDGTDMEDLITSGMDYPADLELDTYPQGGTLEYMSFYSEYLGENRSVTVYLPEGYDPEGSERYPAIYWLHGALCDQNTMNGLITAVMDSLIAESIVAPAIVFKPDGNAGPFWGLSWWTTSELMGEVEEYMVYEVVEFADTNYRTVPSRYLRGICGHSMGGYGCMKIGLKYPEVFRGIGANSGHLDWRVVMELWRPLILEENHPGPPYTYSPYNGNFTAGTFSIAAAFSPNLENPPWNVDFPLDEWGEFIESVMERWDLHDACYLASQLPPPPWAPTDDIGIYFDCGTQDEYLLYESNESFAACLDSLGIPYTFWGFEGHHADRYPEQFANVVTFFDGLFSASSGIAGDGLQVWPEPKLVAIPSLCGKTSAFALTLPQQSQVRVTAHDALGRLVRTLWEGEYVSGTQTLHWDGLDNSGRAVPKGVYYISVKSPAGCGTSGRVVVTR